MTKIRKEVLAPAGKPADLIQQTQPPILQLLQLEEIIRDEQRKIEAEIEGMCGDLRRLLAAPTMSASERPRWQKMQKNLKRLLRNPTYSSHYEFRSVAKEFIAFDLTEFPAPVRSDSSPP